MIDSYEISNDFIGVFETGFDCTEVITFFDKMVDYGFVQYRSDEDRKDAEVDLHNIPGNSACSDLIFDVGCEQLQRYHDLTKHCFALYAKKFNCFHRMDLQQIYARIQKTSQGEGFHRWHFENKTGSTVRRIIASTLYLNTVHEGGETEFLHLSRRVAAKAGRFVLFPASWTHLHRGNPPLSGPKYIVTSWIEAKG